MEKYVVEKIIGEGTYGIVYKAVEKSSKDLVAIKKFKFQSDESMSKRELQACSMLNHPNIIAFRYSFRGDGFLHLVFDYAPSTLSKVIAKYKQGLRPAQVRSVAFQLCKAIHCCHQNKIIHRDIKPENILLDDKGNVKLCDFGVARSIQFEGEALSDYVATRWYRPPEQELRCTNYSYSADIWSIGCVVAEMFLGHPLFRGENQMDQIKLIQEMLGPLPQALATKLPKGIAFAKSSCQTQSLKDRFVSTIPTDGLDFIARTVALDTKRRMTSTECLNHPFFAKLREAELVEQRSRRRRPTLERDDIEEDIDCKDNSGDELDESGPSLDDMRIDESMSLAAGMAKDGRKGPKAIRGSKSMKDGDDIQEIIEDDDNNVARRRVSIHGSNVSMHSDHTMYDDDFEDYESDFDVSKLIDMETTTMADEYEEYNEEEEVEEVEELVDDIPMFIANRIYLGSIDAARNASGMASKDIRMVLSVLSPYDKLNLPDEVARRHVRVDLEDDYEEHLFSKLPYLLHCIERFLQEEPEGNILVHCIAGVSRSASIVAAYLMVKENLDPQAALKQIRLSRPWVDPNSHFLDHLTLFHQIHSHAEVDSPILAAALNVELPSLPKLHFHSQFVHPISLNQTKTLTIRLESDKEDDPQSNLSSIYRFSTVVAVTEATEHFSFLHVTAVEHCTIDQLTLEHAQGEGLSSVADLMGVLDFFYPNLPGDAKVIVIHFRLVANIIKEDL